MRYSLWLYESLLLNCVGGDGASIKATTSYDNVNNLAFSALT